MAMVKDYLYNAFQHGIEAGKLQYGVGQEILDDIVKVPGVGAIFLGID